MDASSSTTGNERDDRYPEKIAAHKITRAGFDEQLSFVPVDDILYIFTAGALSPKRLLIDAPWAASLRLPSNRVYLRTDKGLFVAGFSALTEMVAQLKNFFRIHNSIAFNLSKIQGANLTTKRKQIAVFAGDKAEWLEVSKRAIGKLKRKTSHTDARTHTAQSNRWHAQVTD